MKGSARDDRGRLGASCAVLVCALALAGCADSLAGMSLPSMPKLDDINPFAEKPVPLPGKRVAVIQQENIATNLAGADKPITLPPPRENDSWTQPGGIPSNAPGHLAFAGATKSSWTADIGQGSTFFGRLTASPIVYDGKVYVLDAAGTISAFNVSGGSVWRVSVTPPGEKDREGFGGGLAADGGRIYAATGYGMVFALDARTGNKLWEKNVEAPVRTSPTAVGERVFVITKDGHVFCLSGSDGTDLWRLTANITTSAKRAYPSTASPPTTMKRLNTPTVMPTWRPSSSIRRSSSVRVGSPCERVPASLPMALRGPVHVTSSLVWPRTINVPLRSASPSLFSTASDSPVSSDSSAPSDSGRTAMPSAGTRSPASMRTESPGTSSVALRCSSEPSRNTQTCGELSFSSSSSARSERYS